MPNEHHANKTNVWAIRVTLGIAQVLLIAGILLLAIGTRNGQAWMRWIGGLFLASFLFMPMLLATFKPHLAALLMHALLNLPSVRYPVRGGLPVARTPEPAPRWSEMTSTEKTAVYLAALIGAVLGAVILCYLTMPPPP